MTREDLILATALTLFAAFALGWFACWLLGRVTRPGNAEIGAVKRMAADLHAAEDRLNQAIDEGKKREAALHERVAFTSSELSSARAALSDASEEIEELRAYIEEYVRKR
ncbi:hypothetical protein [Paracoccus sp. SCSIO 75233]|uniref:hypothetical protein n=1 Tax=Paracoccus sp. SCSIO 75233 TaxID=3017782 RepID=UPI0022F13A01|nr:hypothetical protein [Paracoccus sp. SCSIO 75233]WBU54657.1 hypothetical protein PAF12_07465 [Paracoccus sp. SCSIO 75233]